MARRRVSVVTLGCSAAVALLVLPAPAHAQVGSGWTPYSPSKRLQLRGCGAHSSSGGIETFRLTCSTNSGDQRAEQRIVDDYSSGQRQFEGQVRVVSLGGTNISLNQTFQADTGAFLMVAVANSSGGRLYPVGSSSTTMATGVMGTWVRINTVHDVGKKTHQVYINGSLKFTKTGGVSPWYHKYGSYRTGSGRGPVTVQWQNVRFWRK
jgi:ribosomal protein L31